MMLTTIEFNQRLESVQSKIASAAARAGRPAADITLVAVTKSHEPEVILMAADAGLRHFGENRVHEAIAKFPVVSPHLPKDVVWHMIGHIQSRKGEEVAKNFQWVHSVDRVKIAHRLCLGDKKLEVLLEVNLSGEAAKSGYDLSEWPNDAAQAAAFYRAVEEICALDNLSVRGLMTMAPVVDDPNDTRPIFRRLRLLLDEMKVRYPQVRWQHLSMGMTGDFEPAIEEGATMVRIGTALFGERLIRG